MTAPSASTSSAGSGSPIERRVTLRDWRTAADAGQPFALLTCYDATSARWLYRGGVRQFLIGDTAAEFILGHDSTLPATMEFMLEITAAVRRGAPKALLMADMPFGSYQCGDDQAVRNAMAFLTTGQADLVKLEVDASFAPLIERMARAGVPVVAHIGARPQNKRLEGGYRAAGRRPEEAAELVDTAKLLIECGTAALLVEAVPGSVGEQIVAASHRPKDGQRVPVIGCGAGPACHGHVIVLQDLLGLSDWQPPFAPPMARLGQEMQQAAAAWVQHVQSGAYLQDGGPYRSQS